MLEDPAAIAALGHAARRRVEKRFSLQTMVGATGQLYVDLLRQRHPRGQAA
jgi:hypothetical protein